MEAPNARKKPKPVRSTLPAGKRPDFVLGASSVCFRPDVVLGASSFCLGSMLGLASALWSQCEGSIRDRLFGKFSVRVENAFSDAMRLPTRSVVPCQPALKERVRLRAVRVRVRGDSRPEPSLNRLHRGRFLRRHAAGLDSIALRLGLLRLHVRLGLRDDDRVRASIRDRAWHHLSLDSLAPS